MEEDHCTAYMSHYQKKNIHHHPIVGVIAASISMSISHKIVAILQIEGLSLPPIKYSSMLPLVICGLMKFPFSRIIIIKVRLHCTLHTQQLHAAFFTVFVEELPARPNGIYIDEVDVQSDLIAYEGLSVSDSLKYFTRYLTYTVEYTVHYCAVGIPLLSYTATNDDLITIQKTVGATSGVTGEFTVFAPQFAATGVQTWQTFPYNVDDSTLETWLEETFDIGDIQVIGGGTCHEVTYDIQWLERGGDQEPLVVDGSSLIQEIGNNTSSDVETITDGGVFLRPFRGDMLRLPKKDPQVNK